MSRVVVLVLLGLTALLSSALPSPALAGPVLSGANVPMAQGYRLATVAEGLRFPWAMAWLPGGGILITEKPGAVRLFKDGALSAPLPGAPEALHLGQGGLLDIALHPDFATNRLVYFTLAHGTSGENRTRLVRAVFDGEKFSDLKAVFEVSQAKSGGQHFGARMAWLPDKTLLVSIGDGGNPPVRLGDKFIREQAQNPGSHLGKVLRFTDEGGVPADNPFVGQAEAEPAVFSLGHRNIQGLTWDPVRQVVWASEHGALGGDEFNRLEKGRNFGWPLATHSREYLGGRKISDHTSKKGKADPLLVWQTAIAPSGLAVYTGDAFPAWKGDVFAGGLVSQDVRRLRLNKQGAIQGEEAIRVGQRVRDVRQGPDGMLYLLTDESNGRLIRVEPAAGDGPSAP